MEMSNREPQFQDKSLDAWIALLESGDEAPDGLFEAFRNSSKLFMAALKHKDPEVRAGAARFLRQFGHGFDYMVVDERDEAGRTLSMSMDRNSPGFAEYARLAPALASALKDPSKEVRRHAAEALKTLALVTSHSEAAPVAAVPALIDALGDEGLREAAVHTIGMIGQKAGAAAPALLDLLGNKDLPEELRSHAASALGSIQQRQPDAISALMEALKSGNPGVRQSAARALGSFGLEAKCAVPQLEAAATDEDPSVRASALSSLARVDRDSSAAFPLLLRGAKDTQPEVRRSSVLSLGQLQEKPNEIVGPLYEALCDADAMVRAAAAHGLALVGHWVTDLSKAGVSREALIERLRNCVRDEDPMVRNAAAGSLVNWGARDAETASCLKESARKAKGGHLANIIMGLANAGRYDPETREILGAAVDDSSEQVRIMAVVALGEDAQKNEESARKLECALSDESSSVRLFAARALLETESYTVAAGEALKRLLQDPSETVRVRAAGFLLRKHPREKELVSILLDALKHEREEMRREAITCVGNSGCRDAAIETALRSLLGEPGSRSGAAWALSSLGCMDRDIALILAEELKEQSPLERRSAVESLVRMGQGALPALPSIAAALKDSDAHVRAHAAVCLGRIGAAAREAIPGLMEALEDEDKRVRCSAAAGLGRMGFSGPEAREALKQLSADPSEKVRAMAAQALAAMGPDAVPAIQAALADAAAVVRQCAAVSLGRLGPAAGPAAPLLRKALEDSSEEVRKAAEWALARIQGTEPGGGAPSSPSH